MKDADKLRAEVKDYKAKYEALAKKENKKEL